MAHDMTRLLDAVLLLASELPAAIVGEVARALDEASPGEWEIIRARVQSVAASPRYRSLSTGLLDTWKTETPEVTPEAVSSALLTAARCREAIRQEQAVELTWTGPDSGAVPFRRTEDALLELIEAARERLTVVAFAMYKVPYVRDALVVAARRGVALRVIVESPEESEGKVTFDGLRALGSEVARSARVYAWPRDKRPTNTHGRYGSLHVKCAIADDTGVFISSANLTEFALTLNMEMGLLVRGGSLPRRVVQHFDGLIEKGVLTKIGP